MKVIVVSKRTWIGILICLLLLGVGLVVYFYKQETEQEPASATMATIDSYELNAIPVMSRLVPVYRVSRDDQAIALTIDAAWSADKTRFILDTLDRYGIKATFFLCGVWVKAYPDMVKEIAARGHEIAAHGYKHKWLTALPAPQVLYEVLRDRRELEAIVKRPVTGLAYAMGDYDGRVIELLRKAGFAYARTVHSSRSFRTPIDSLEWHPTCHHADPRLMELAKSFVENTADNDRPLLFYLWGHSYEFVEGNNWEIIERFADFISGREDLWYVTNGELIAYMEAYKSLRFDAKRGIVYNPSAIDIYFFFDGKNLCAPAGKTTKL